MKLLNTPALEHQDTHRALISNEPVWAGRRQPLVDLGAGVRAWSGNWDNYIFGISWFIPHPHSYIC